MKKIIIGILCLGLVSLLTGCSEIAKDIARETTSEISSENVATDYSGLGITKVITLSAGEKTALSSTFSGHIYIMVAKEELSKVSSTNFSLSSREFHKVKEGRAQDFNIRYHGKTYFTSQWLEVKSLESIKIASEYPSKFLVALQSSK